MQIVLARTTFQQQAKDIPNQNKKGMQLHTWTAENWKESHIIKILSDLEKVCS